MHTRICEYCRWQRIFCSIWAVPMRIQCPKSVLRYFCMALGQKSEKIASPPVGAIAAATTGHYHIRWWMRWRVQCNFSKVQLQSHYHGYKAANQFNTHRSFDLSGHSLLQILSVCPTCNRASPFNMPIKKLYGFFFFDDFHLKMAFSYVFKFQVYRPFTHSHTHADNAIARFPLEWCQWCCFHRHTFSSRFDTPISNNCQWQSKTIFKYAPPFHPSISCVWIVFFGLFSFIFSTCLSFFALVCISWWCWYCCCCGHLRKKKFKHLLEFHWE